MQTYVTFKNLDPSDPLKNYVQSKLDRIDKLLDNPAEANVVFSVEKIRHTAEINLTGDRLNIQAKEETENMYSSIDLVVDKLKKQITKSKDKIRQRRPISKNGLRGEAASSESGVSSEDEEGDTRIIIRNIEYKPMNVDEAVLQSEINNEDFFVFINSSTDQVNVLYRRKDDNLGLIQPQS